MATDPKPYTLPWTRCGMRLATYQIIRHLPSTATIFVFAFFFVASAQSTAPSGPRPAGHGRGQGRVPSQTPSWQMGSSNDPIVMSVIDPADPWTDNTSKRWPLEEHHYAEVFAVCASFETDDPPLWSVLFPLALRPRRCPPRKSCLLYTSPSPRDATLSRMPSSA